MYITRTDIESAYVYQAIQAANGIPDDLEKQLGIFHEYLQDSAHGFDEEGILEIKTSTQVFDILKKCAVSSKYCMQIFSQLWHDMSKIKLDQDAIRGLCFMPKRDFEYKDLVAQAKKMFPKEKETNIAIQKLLKLFYTEHSVDMVFTSRIKK